MNAPSRVSELCSALSPASEAVVGPSREEAEAAVRMLIRWAGDDPDREGLKTRRRASQGRSGNSIPATANARTAILDKKFEEVQGYSEIVLVRDIPFYSHCEHHMVPFFGMAHIGYYPSDGVVGLSKLARLVEVFARRLQTQETMTAQISDALVAASCGPGRGGDAGGRAHVHVDARRAEGRRLERSRASSPSISRTRPPAGDIPDARPGLTGAVPLPLPSGSAAARKACLSAAIPARRRACCLAREDLDADAKPWRLRPERAADLPWHERVRLDDRRGGFLRRARRGFRGRADLHRHRRRVFDLGAGPPGRRIGDHHRALDEGPRQPRRHRPGDQGRRRDGARPQGPEARLHPPRRRGFACAVCRPTASNSTSRTGTMRRRRRKKRSPPTRTSSGPARCARSAPRTSAAPA